MHWIASDSGTHAAEYQHIASTAVVVMNTLTLPWPATTSPASAAVTIGTRDVFSAYMFEASLMATESSGSERYLPFVTPSTRQSPSNQTPEVRRRYSTIRKLIVVELLSLLFCQWIASVRGSPSRFQHTKECSGRPLPLCCCHGGKHLELTSHTSNTCIRNLPLGPGQPTDWRFILRLP